MEHDEQPLTGYLTIDGIEGEVARVELPDGTTADWSLSSLPPNVQEDDIIKVMVEAGDLEIEVDQEATLHRKKLLQDHLKALNEPSTHGDITL